MACATQIPMDDRMKRDYNFIKFVGHNLSSLTVYLRPPHATICAILILLVRVHSVSHDSTHAWKQGCRPRGFNGKEIVSGDKNGSPAFAPPLARD